VNWVRQGDFADCEAPDGWMLAQDVNAWSSLSYLAAGLGIVVAVVRWRVPRAFLGLAVAIAVEGLGSMLYHGDPTDTAQLLHDAALVASLGFVTGWHVGRLARRADAGACGREPIGEPTQNYGRFVSAAKLPKHEPLRSTVPAYPLYSLGGLSVGVVAGVIGTATSTSVTNGFVAGAVIVLIVAEVRARRHGLPAVWNGATVALVGFALLAWMLGTTDSPVCAPQSWAQPHALWHVLSALVVLVWVDRAAASVAPDQPPAAAC
jgi:hypothetical protein